VAAPDIVYCGGCNPQIDRGAIARELEVTAAQTVCAKMVLLSGCARACASDHQLVDETAGVVVAGEMVDGVATSAAGIAGAIATAIARKMEGSPTPVKE
jgi:hypothetical protein